MIPSRVRVSTRSLISTRDTARLPAISRLRHCPVTRALMVGIKGDGKGHLRICMHATCMQSNAGVLQKANLVITGQQHRGI